MLMLSCSKTTLTGESQFHRSTPLGIEPGSLMTGSKRVDHWPVELCVNVVRLQALHSLYVNKCRFGGKQVWGVSREQGVQKQLTSCKGPERMEISHHEQETAFQVREFIFFLSFILSKYAPARDLLVCTK